jgi:hypothetical protein
VSRVTRPRRTTVPGTRASGSGVPGTSVPGSDVPGSDPRGSDAPGSDAPGSDAPRSDAAGTSSRGTSSRGTSSRGTSSRGTRVWGIIARGTSSRGTIAALAVPAGLVAAIIVPLLRPGYVLSYDMVFVPRQPFTGAMFGLGGGVARAVPSDFVVALLARIAPGDVVEKVVLAAILLGAAYGVVRLVRDAPTLARVAAASFYLWNAYVYERLVLGHWAVLLGYAALPWAVAGALGVRQGRPRAIRHTALAVAVAAIGGYGSGVIVSAVAVLLVLWPEPGRMRRALQRSALILGSVLVLNAPWLVPSLLRPSGVPSGAAGVGAFAARSDTSLGLLGSLLALGGVWNAEVVPPGRGSVAVALASLVLLAIAAAGLPRLRDRLGGRAATALGVAAAGGLAIAAAPHLPGLGTLVEYMVVNAPGGGVLRDSQKYLMPLAFLEAVAFGLGASWLVGMANQQPVRRTGAVLAALAPVAVLPALALGAGGRLSPVEYPAGWSAARAVVAGDPVGGAVAVLPWHLYRAFPWNEGRSTLDPAPRFFDRPVVVNDTLELADRAVPGEDPWARRLDPLMRGTGPLPDALAGQYVRYVLVERTEYGAADVERRLEGAEAVLRGPDLALYRLPDPAGSPPGSPPVVPVVLADVCAAVLFLSLLFVPYRVCSQD